MFRRLLVPLVRPARLELALDDAEVARELGVVSPDLLDEPLRILASDERLDDLAERVIGTRAEILNRVDDHRGVSRPLCSVLRDLEDADVPVGRGQRFEAQAVQHHRAVLSRRGWRCDCENVRALDVAVESWIDLVRVAPDVAAFVHPGLSIRVPTLRGQP